MVKGEGEAMEEEKEVEVAGRAVTVAVEVVGVMAKGAAVVDCRYNSRSGSAVFW